MNVSPYGYPLQRPHDYLSESVLSEEIHPMAVPGHVSPILYPHEKSTNEKQEFYQKDSYSPNRIHLTQPRPLNPELDIHFNADTIPSIPNGFHQPILQSMHTPPVAENTIPPEDNFQLMALPSSSSSMSLDSFSEWMHQGGTTENLNHLLEEVGLPCLDFSKCSGSNKDAFYQNYIREIADAYGRRETILKKLAKKTFYTDDDKPVIDKLGEVNEKVDKIIKENKLISRTDIVENVQHIGRRLKKAEKKSAILDYVFSIIENDDNPICPEEDFKTMDSEFDQRVDQNIRRIDHMKKYKSRYKSMLFMKYKVVDMLNRMTDGSIDSLIDVDKLIRLIDTYKFSLKRVDSILNNKSYTPEWKVKELRELFGVTQ